MWIWIDIPVHERTGLENHTGGGDGDTILKEASQPGDDETEDEQDKKKKGKKDPDLEMSPSALQAFIDGPLYALIDAV